MFRVTKLLEEKGHEVAHFSFKHSRNRHSPYEQFFPEHPYSSGGVYFKETKSDKLERLSQAIRLVYNREAHSKLCRLIKHFEPEIAYILQAVNYMYSTVIYTLSKLHVPIIARQSDFQLLCPAYTFFRNGNVCEDCKKGYIWAIKNKCMQNSYGVTISRVLAMYVYKFLRIQEKIDVIITPSKFLQYKLIEYGLDKSKIINIPSFIDINKYEPCYDHKPYVLYVGNIQRYKGVKILIKAMKNMNGATKLKVVGTSNDGEDQRLMKYVMDERLNNVEFLGFKYGEELRNLYQNAMFVVVPSVWYENMPNVILESMAYGKPVVGSKLGSIPEMIGNNIDGLCFEPSNYEDLKQKIQYLCNNRETLLAMGKRARHKVEEKYNSEIHYKKLMKVYQQVLADRRRTR